MKQSIEDLILEKIHECYLKYNTITFELFQNYTDLSLLIPILWGNFESAVIESNKIYSFDPNFKIELPLKPTTGHYGLTASEETKQKLREARFRIAKESHPDEIFDFTKEEVIINIHKFYNEYNTLSFEKFLSYTHYNKKAFKRNTPGWINLLKELDLYKDYLKENNPKKASAVKGKEIVYKIKDITKDFCFSEAERIYNQFGNLTKDLFFKESHIDHKSFKVLFKDFYEFRNQLPFFEEISKKRYERNPRKRTYNSKEEVTNALIEMYNKTNSKFTLTEFLNSYPDITYISIKKYFKTFSNAAEELNLFKGHRVERTKDEIIDYMWKLYNKHGKLNADIQRKDGFITQSNIKNVFGSFSNMLIEMGLKPNCGKNISDEQLLSELKDLLIQYGRIDTYILGHYAKFSRPTYLSRFGNMEGIYNALNIPYLRNNSKLCNKLFTYLLQIIPFKLEREKTFYWLKNIGHLFIDIYCDELKLAIEYDGSQHYQYVHYHNQSYEDWLKACERDKLKEQLCNEHSIKLIRFQEKDLKSIESVKQKLLDNNVLL